MTLVRRQRNRMQLVACNLFLVNLLGAVRNTVVLRSILARRGSFFFFFIYRMRWATKGGYRIMARVDRAFKKRRTVVRQGRV